MAEKQLYCASLKRNHDSSTLTLRGQFIKLFNSSSQSAVKGVGGGGGGGGGGGSLPDWA